MADIADAFGPGLKGLANEKVSSDLSALLGAGVKAISGNQVIRFYLYNQYVLPVDGYVFWIKDPNTYVDVQGSLHMTSEQQQQTDGSQSLHHIIFTALKRVDAFNDIDSKTMYIGEYQDQLFGFNKQVLYYDNSNLHHYIGQAIRAEMYTQFLDSTAAIPTSQVLTNSIPFWLSLTGGPQFNSGETNSLYVFGEYLVAGNFRPPYIAVEIVATDAVETLPVPIYVKGDDGITRKTVTQLMKDRVRLHVWGFNQSTVLAYWDYLESQFRAGIDMGLVSGPTIRDDVRTQSEYNIRGQKKVIELEVDYYIHEAFDYAVQRLLETQPNFKVIEPDGTTLYEGPGYLVPPNPFPSTSTQ